MPDNKKTRKAVSDAMLKLSTCKAEGLDQSGARKALKKALEEYDRKE